MRGNYDRVAWFYDGLSKLAYGNSIVNAQVFLLQFIPPNSSILIAGGGTGWILEEIAKVQPLGLKIVYVDVSENMIALAQKRKTADNEVIFINTPIEMVNSDMRFDIVITAFLFDNFTQQRAADIFERVHSLLKKTGSWLYTDFEIEAGDNFWQKALLKMMYLFLGPLCQIETSKLPDMKKLFFKHSYKLTTEKTFFRKFMTSRIYTKQGE